MEYLPAKESCDSMKTSTSPSKKGNGVECNGIMDHQADCDMSNEGQSLSSNSADVRDPEASSAKQALVNGFSNPPEQDKMEKPGQEVIGENVAVPDVPNLDKETKESETSAEEQSCDTIAVPVKEEVNSPSRCSIEKKEEDVAELKVEENAKQQEASLAKTEPMLADEVGDSGVPLKTPSEENKSEETPVSESSKSIGQSVDSHGEPQNLPLSAFKSALDEKSDDEKVKNKLNTADDQITSVGLPSKSGEETTEQEMQNSGKDKEDNEKVEQSPKKANPVERSESTNDDIEIIGESFTQSVPTQGVASVNSSLQRQQLNAGFVSAHSNSLLNNNIQNALLLQNMRIPGPHSNLTGTVAPPGSGNYVFPGGFPPAQGVSLLNSNTANAPPIPKSSMDQIELIRWEIQNRINVRPKYFKPNPSSELGPLAKFLFDIGSDLIKESVYHDLVKIQSKKNDDDKLSEKEREDLAKLKEIEKDLQATIGHLKLRLRKRCQSCGFQTESSNVLFFHKQFPHEDNKNLRCSHCAFSTKQSMAFKFHMEAEHAIQGRLHEKKAFFECHMCPYENNQEQKLLLHHERCLKQFRPLFNLHPSCLSGAEINLCLENIFYKPIVPKNLKLLQQKHAQQQAALAEAKRQQAQMQIIAAQKNAAALAAKKQQQQQQQQLLQLQKRQLPHLAPRFNANLNPRAQSLLPRPGLSPQQQQQNAVRYNAKSNRPTVANMLNNKANMAANNKANMGAMPAQNSPPGGFEVCEICGGYVKDRKALRIHFFYAHRIDLPFNLFERSQAPLYCATCYVRFWTAQGLRKHIDTHKEENQTRGVVGKCISCGHHVLNLLLHMRIVHNRELQHYINALMCMFCGGHFSSRQDCERHIIKTHGNVDPVSGTLKSPPLASQAVSPQPSNAKSGSAQKKSSSGKGSNASNLVKGSVCVLCNLNFGRNVDLTRHCMRMHHTCMKCGMVVIDKASLLKHTCLTSPSGTRDCGMCGESGFHPAYYVKHLRDKHLRKFSIKSAKVSRDVIERWTKRPCPFEDKQEILVEISDSDDDSATTSGSQGRLARLRSPIKKPKIGPLCSKIKKPIKKPKIGPASKIGRRPLIIDTEGGNEREKESDANSTNQSGKQGEKEDKKSIDVNHSGERKKNEPKKYEKGCGKAASEINSKEETEDHRNGTVVEEKDEPDVEKNSKKGESCEAMPTRAEKRKSLEQEYTESPEKKRKPDALIA
ncbi:mog interacting and ectopic p-granules protein 1 [Plakobranchus ocellatus]|uniref:Mog interacting and ectopic p-granules protein 1 n=1 Tax=Plakobranchus ocellatus TaxID=259542 RepID=A0AAV4BY57_9GAST|nr:mog interacting and ectopic p-granules protein 1 [Plakobranchus ocellatus]